MPSRAPHPPPFVALGRLRGFYSQLTTVRPCACSCRLGGGGAGESAAPSPCSSDSRELITPRPVADAGPREAGTVRDSASNFSDDPTTTGYRTESDSDGDHDDVAAAASARGAAASGTIDVTIVPALRAAPGLTADATAATKPRRRRRMSTQEQFYLGSRNEGAGADAVVSPRPSPVQTNLVGAMISTPREDDDENEEQDWNALDVRTGWLAATSSWG